MSIGRTPQQASLPLGKWIYYDIKYLHYRKLFPGQSPR